MRSKRMTYTTLENTILRIEQMEHCFDTLLQAAKSNPDSIHQDHRHNIHHPHRYTYTPVLDSGRLCKEESVQAPVEHAPRIFHSTRHTVVCSNHTCDSGTDPQERSFRGHRRIHDPSMLYDPYVRKYAQDRRMCSCSYDNEGYAL